MTLDITQVAVVGTTLENWPAIKQVWQLHGYSSELYGEGYPLYGSHVSIAYGDSLNGWAGGMSYTFTKQVKYLRQGASALIRLTAAEFIETFGQE